MVYAEREKTLRKALQVAFRNSKCRVFGKPKIQCSGLVFGVPLKRSQSSREDPENIQLFIRSLIGENLGDHSVREKIKKGVPKQCGH